MDLKTFIKRYTGCKVIYKGRASRPSGVSPPASEHQKAAIRKLVLKGITYRNIAYKALGFLAYGDELTHDQAVRMIRIGNAMYKRRMT